MRIHDFFKSVEIHRNQKAVIVNLMQPFRVGSTCQVNGGVRDDITVIFNSQTCEPTKHKADLLKIATHDPMAYHRITCDRLGLPADTSVSLGTAANMNNVVVAHEKFRDLEVVSIATGGVETNAGRAGDSAAYYESNGSFQRITDIEAVEHGTINLILLINKPITKGATYRAVMTATEAKSALLQELNVYSRYSQQLATGTGTDQMAIASRLNGEESLTSTGKHSKLGELIGKASYKAIKETLEFQNQLTPTRQCSVMSHLARFGVTEQDVLNRIAVHLPEHLSVLFNDNFISLDRDPITVASVAGLLNAWDKVTWGILPDSCINELLSLYSAEIASAVSGLYDKHPHYRKLLFNENRSIDTDTLVNLISHSMATGFKDKWKHLDQLPGT